VVPREPVLSNLSADERDALAVARAFAKTEAWTDVLATLGPLAANPSPSGELALLYGEALMRTGRERSALQWLRDVQPALSTTDRGAERHLVNLIGAACFALGELSEAMMAFSRALDLAEQNGDVLLLARATNNLGAIANLQGRFEDALWHYRLAIPAYQRAGQPRGIAEGHHNLAITLRDLGQLDEADENERRTIEYAADGGAPRLAAMGRVGRAEVALRRGDPKLAEMTARMSIEELGSLDDPMNEADARRVVGVACAAQQRYDEALASLARALEIAREHGHALVEAETLRDRAEIRVRVGERALALADARDSLAIFEKLGATAECEALRARIEALG
jgi:tetratricopeptide (TPR) repeat protein